MATEQQRQKSNYVTETLGNGVMTKHHKDPYRMVRAMNRNGYVQEIKIDSHSPVREDEYRAEGFLIEADYKTPEQKKEFERIGKERQRAHEAAERQQVLHSPKGRAQLIQMAIADEAAARAVADSERRTASPAKVDADKGDK